MITQPGQVLTHFLGSHYNAAVHHALREVGKVHLSKLGYASSRQKDTCSAMTDIVTQK